MNCKQTLEAILERVRASAVAIRAIGLDDTALVFKAGEIWSELERCKRTPTEPGRGSLGTPPSTISQLIV